MTGTNFRKSAFSFANGNCVEVGEDCMNNGNCIEAGSGPATAETPESAPAPVDVNDLPVTPAAARLYNLCSAWEREAFRIPSMPGEKDARARALMDCAVKLRASVNDLRRDGEL